MSNNELLACQFSSGRCFCQLLTLLPISTPMRSGREGETGCPHELIFPPWIISHTVEQRSTFISSISSPLWCMAEQLHVQHLPALGLCLHLLQRGMSALCGRQSRTFRHINVYVGHCLWKDQKKTKQNKNLAMWTGSLDSLWMPSYSLIPLDKTPETW